VSEIGALNASRFASSPQRKSTQRDPSVVAGRDASLRSGACLGLRQRAGDVPCLRARIPRARECADAERRGIDRRLAPASRSRKGSGSGRSRSRLRSSAIRSKQQTGTSGAAPFAPSPGTCPRSGDLGLAWRLAPAPGTTNGPHQATSKADSCLEGDSLGAGLQV
jgi:hypothetical protein